MPKKVTASPSRATATTKTLALSEAHLRLQFLEKEHQKLLKQIKKKRSELKNFVEQMRSVATEVFTKATPSFQKMAEVDREIHALFDEILTTRQLGKKSRKKIIQIYNNLQSAGIVSPKEDEDDSDEELDELFEMHEQSAEDFRSSYQSQRPQDLEIPSVNRSNDSKKIRSLFLRLAEIFHPDKVTDEETQMRHTEIMKEINKAYQDGDLARLLEIEKQHDVGEFIDTSNQDEVALKCTRVEQQNELLKNQLTNLKREMRLAKKSPEGAMVSDFRKVTKHGIDPIAQMLEQLTGQISIVSQIRDYVRDFRDEKISINKFLEGPDVLCRMQEEMMDELYEEMFGDEEFIYY